MKQINWGIIGCGDVTERKSGPAFNKIAGSKLVAVMRRNAEKAKDYAYRHHVPTWYNDAKKLIADAEVNAIYVATPPVNHAEFCVAALNAGKPVYVEKPMSTNVESAKKMMEAAEQTGIKLSVAHYRRQLPYFKKIKSLIDEDAIGRVLLVNLQVLQPSKSEIIGQTEDQWRLNPSISGGGYFYDLAPHQLDLLIYFFGSDYTASGISENLSRAYYADDATSGSILFNKEVLFTGTWCFSCAPEHAKDYCEIIGTMGRITFSFFDWKPIILDAGNRQETFNLDSLEHVQLPMIEKVVEYFRDEGPNPCSAKDGVEVMKLMEIFTKKS